MNQRRRFAAGAAIAGLLVAAPASLANSSPDPAEASTGSTPDWPVATVPLPDGLAQCLIENGFPALSPGTQVELPAVSGTPPASFAGTIPLSGTSVPTTSGTIPLSVIPTSTDTSQLPGIPKNTDTNQLPEIPTSTDTSQLPEVPTSTDTSQLPGAGLPGTPTTDPVPTGGGATSTGGIQCGQFIINNTMYVVLVALTNTTTTTTTTANGPMTAASGPVTIGETAPAAAPVTTTTNNPPAAVPAPAPVTPVATAKEKPKQKPKRRRHRRKRSSVRKHSTHNRGRQGKPALHIVLVRKSPVDR
jgi:hypothetical protein